MHALKRPSRDLLAGASLLAFAVSAASPAGAGDEPFLGEVMAVGFTFCPLNTVEANGQLIPITASDETQILYSLIGTTFGGDGRITFAVPDLRGASPIQAGQGPGLTRYYPGVREGSPFETMTLRNLPRHSHPLEAAETTPTTNSPAGNALTSFPTGRSSYADAGAAFMTQEMSPDAITATGGDPSPVDLRQPFMAVRYCVAVYQGAYPGRN